MSIPRRLSVAVPVTGAVLAALLSGCENPQAALTARADAAASAPVTRVAAVKPTRATLRKTVDEPGQIQAFETTAIHAKIAGFLRNITVDIGSKLKKGQIVAELWVPELVAERDQKRATVRQTKADRAQGEAAVNVAQAAVVSAEAKLDEIQAGIKRAAAELARWQSEAKRVGQLVRESVVTGSLYDETRSKLQAAEAAVDFEQAELKSAQAAVLQSRAELEKARADLFAASARVDVAQQDAGRVEALLAYTKIDAPYDGVVTLRNFHTGHLTQPGAAAEPLFMVARTDLARIAVDVPEMAAMSVEPGDRALIRLQALNGRTFEGKVTRISWALEPKTRTLRAEVDIPNKDGLLRPGLYAYATIIAEEHANVLALPATALFSKDGKTYCVAVENKQAVRKPVETGLSDGTLTEIRSGLSGTELIVKAYAESLAPGQPLEVTAVEPVATKGAKP